LERATYELIQSQYKIKYNLEDGISMFFLSDVKRLPGKKPNDFRPLLIRKNCKLLSYGLMNGEGNPSEIINYPNPKKR